MKSDDAVSILDLVFKVSQNVPTSPCCILENGSKSLELTYGAALKCLERHQETLQEAIDKLVDGSSRDTVVAFLSGNCVDLLLSMLACTSPFSGSASVVAALLNTRWTATEMAKSLKSKGKHATTILFYSTEYQSMAREVIRQTGHKAYCMPLPTLSSDFVQSSEQLSSERHVRKGALPRVLGDSPSEMIDRIQANGLARDAFIVFTSGTTGGSKGVRLSHRALCIQALAKINRPCAYSSETSMLASTVPLFHVGGLSSCLAVVLAGGSLFFPQKTSGGFKASMVRSSLEHPILPVNTLVVVPAMLATYFSDPESVNRVYEHVRLVLVGGQSAPETMVQQIKGCFPNARIVQTYACTEAASSLTFLHLNPSGTERHPKQETTEPTPLLDKADCVGISPPHVCVRLYRKGKRGWNILNLPNETGVIATRGPHVMNGYWDRGSETPQANLTGWFLTTDLGSFDEHGRLYFRGRIKDVIRTGGETVFAQEVERVLLKHPHISACAVFPRKDDRFGEAVACAIVTNQVLEIGTIKDWCSQHNLATYKRPRYLFLVDDLPRNSSGKVLKHKLVESFDKPRSKL